MQRPKPRCQSLQVLLVEDNPGDVRLIREAFEECEVDCEVALCMDGEGALDYLHGRDEYGDEPRPDLLLLDLNVPKKDGMTILEQMSTDRRLQRIPIVVLSGSKSPDDVHGTYELGAESYFVKPADPNEFIETVRAVCESFANEESLPAGEFSDIDRSE